MEKASITRANETNEHYWEVFSVVVLQGVCLGGWDLWHGKVHPCTIAWTVHSKPDGVYREVVVSVGPAKAATGVQQESLLLVSYLSCL